MEKGCSAASSNCSGAEDDAQQEQSRRSSSSSSCNSSYSIDLKPPTPQASQPKASTSQGVDGTVTESMSNLREPDVEDCVSSNSQHGFAVVLDDESSTETTGVLETYEISSSNSLPNSTGAGAGAETMGVVVVVPVDDSSSTDTLNGNENERMSRDAPSEEEEEEEHNSPINNVFFNVNDEPPVVCLINDDDDFDEEEIVDEDEDDDEDEDAAGRSCPNTSQVDGTAAATAADGIITTADGSKIFLETPVVEEPQQSHTHVGGATVGGSAAQSELLAGKPKRLSDEFEAEEQQQQLQGNAPRGGVKSEPGQGQGQAVDVATSSLHDRQMSVRLKQMSLTASAEASAANAAAATNSTNNSNSPTKADIESMDRIERRDFETEQRLTGGIILGTNSLVTKNRLNLSLINRAAAAVGAGGGAGVAGDDWPSSSQARAFSSDSKVRINNFVTEVTVIKAAFLTLSVVHLQGSIDDAHEQSQVYKQPTEQVHCQTQSGLNAGQCQQQCLSTAQFQLHLQLQLQQQQQHQQQQFQAAHCGHCEAQREQQRFHFHKLQPHRRLHEHQFERRQSVRELPAYGQRCGHPFVQLCGLPDKQPGYQRLQSYQRLALWQQQCRLSGRGCTALDVSHFDCDFDFSSLSLCSGSHSEGAHKAGECQCPDPGAFSCTQWPGSWCSCECQRQSQSPSCGGTQLQ